MAPFPLPLSELLLKPGEFLVYMLVGLFFGIALEISGFASSPKLAAQFYFKDLTVLKVMFSAIVVAMVLIFLASGLGLLDYNLVWVNPTYLWPGIVGGLIMGVGFIVGGFCPGTSLVALATRKIDGLFFTLGGLFGIFLFGETVGLFDIFWNSSYLGRFTIPDWLGLSTGVVVLLVVFMALFMFWGGEHLERIFGGKNLKLEPRLRYAGAGGLVLLAGLVFLIGQPATADRWARLAPEKELLLNARSVQIHPGELLASMHDHRLKLELLDVRSEADYNLFHLSDARRTSLEALPALAAELRAQPAYTVFVLMSNDEAAATEAWKILTAESVANVYILEGGVNGWLSTFASGDERIRPFATAKEDALDYSFSAALGSAFPAAEPNPRDYALEYTSKIQLKNQRAVSGGCG
jgi:rhodanese-related sulfurtransferase